MFWSKVYMSTYASMRSTRGSLSFIGDMLKMLVGGSIHYMINHHGNILEWLWSLEHSQAQIIATLKDSNDTTSVIISPIIIQFTLKLFGIDLILEASLLGVGTDEDYDIVAL